MMRIIRVIALALCGILLAAPVSAYDNPFRFYDESRKEMAMGDPFVMKYNGSYYCYTSGGYGYESTDLVNWTYMGCVFSGAHAENLFAPEVFYWNGAFYSISCPNGTTNYIFKSDSLRGPFTAISGELGGGIDGSLFRDDDGSIWFAHAMFNGIALYRMETPESTPQQVDHLPQSMSGMWTESPQIFKRDGIYYMTFTGNHVLDTAYRVEYAMSKESVTDGWIEPEQNILLLATQGETTALGHNSVVIGPDLDSYYIIYHNRHNSGSVDRRFNMQRILWNGEKPVVAFNIGPAEDPAKPSFEYRPQNGTEVISGTHLSDEGTGEVFTAEFNLVPISTDILFSYADEQNFSRISFSETHITLETVKNGVASAQTEKLAQNTDVNALQCVRVQQVNGKLRIYLEGGLLIECEAGAGGRIGYTAQNGRVGYMAFSNIALGNTDSQAEKYTCATYDAVLANNSGELEKVDTSALGDAVVMRTGDKASFDLLAQKKMTATLTLRGKASPGTTLNLYVNGVPVREKVTFDASDDYRTQIFRTVDIAKGQLSVSVEVVSGEFEFYEISSVEETAVEATTNDMSVYIYGLKEQEGLTLFNDGTMQITALAYEKSDCFGKNVMGDCGWGDYTATVTLSMDNTAGDAEAGIFLRSANVSDGEASNFRFNRKWYQQCYYVSVAAGKVRLYKQNYNETLLAEYPTDADFTQPHTLKVAAVDEELIVWLDGKRIISYTDHDYPFTNGRFGFKNVNCTAVYDDLVIVPGLDDTEVPQPDEIDTAAESSPLETTNDTPHTAVKPQNGILYILIGIGVLLIGGATIVVLTVKKKSRK